MRGNGLQYGNKPSLGGVAIPEAVEMSWQVLQSVLVDAHISQRIRSIGW